MSELYEADALNVKRADHGHNPKEHFILSAMQRRVSPEQVKIRGIVHTNKSDLSPFSVSVSLFFTPGFLLRHVVVAKPKKESHMKSPKLLLVFCSLFTTLACGPVAEPSGDQQAATGSNTEPAIWSEKLGFPAGKKVIILHADDIGMCPEANISADRYLTEDHIQSCAVMMPCPNAQEFIAWAKAHPNEDVGLHLTLTSEWKTHRWPGLTSAEEAPGLLDEDGMLWHEVPQVVQHASPEEVEKEIRAQVEQSIAWGYRPDHIDTHMGTLYGSHLYTAAYLKVAEEYQIPAMVIDMQKPEVVAGFKQQGYPINDEMIDMVNNYSLPKLDYFFSAPNAKTYEEKISNFKQLISSLKPGLTEIIFHPSELTDNLKSITNSWQQRAWEAQMFADPDLKQFFADEGIIFTNWKEIMERFKKQM